VTQTLTRTLKSHPLLSYDKRNMYISGLGNIFLFLVCPFLSFFSDGRSPPLLLRSHLSYEKAMDFFATVFFSRGSFKRPCESSLIFKDVFLRQPHIKVHFRGEPL
jgi:hypothetical protein